MKTVYVVGGDAHVIKMFKDRGWDVIIECTAAKWDEFDVDLICFTGGEDVSPELYHEENKGSRGMNPDRDAFEKAVYDEFVGHVPMVGICRGGQLLNVLNGGQMVQDHGLISGDVKCLDHDGESHKVRVDHHQGIVRNVLKSYSILAYELGNHGHFDILSPGVGLTYACYYPDTRSLCFQPHPEWGHKPTEELFFKLLEEYL